MVQLQLLIKAVLVMVLPQEIPLRQVLPIQEVVLEVYMMQEIPQQVALVLLLLGI